MSARLRLLRGWFRLAAGALLLLACPHCRDTSGGDERCEEHVGYLVHPQSEGPSFGVSIEECAGHWRILLQRSDEHDASGRPIWQRLDELTVPPLQASEKIWGSMCEKSGVLDDELVGVGTPDEQHCPQMPAPRLVYRTSRTSGKIQLEPADGVICLTTCGD